MQRRNLREEENLESIEGRNNFEVLFYSRKYHILFYVNKIPRYILCKNFNIDDANRKCPIDLQYSLNARRLFSYCNREIA